MARTRQGTSPPETTHSSVAVVTSETNPGLLPTPDTPAPTFDQAGRRDRLRTGIAGAGADALIVTDLINLRYLTGFTGSNGAALIFSDAAGGDTIATDGRYLTQVAEQSGDLAAIIERDCPAALLAHAVKAGARRIAVEAEHLSLAVYRSLLGGLEESPDAELVESSGLVEALRLVKDATEIDCLARACAIGDAGLAELLAAGAIRPGRTEREVARELENAMYRAGGNGVAFETIVAAGANSAIPHHRPGDAVLAEGDFVKIDFGAIWHGYHSDMTRTFVLGEPANWQREIYDVVHRAQAAGCAALIPGAIASGPDAAARTVITEAGYGERFLHGTGHGIGLRIHEAPGINARATSTLPSGAVVTVEPGVYLAGRGGVRIEDSLVVTDTGPQWLTHTDKALTAL